MIEVFDLSRATDLDKQKLPIKTINGVSPDSNGAVNIPLDYLPLRGGNISGSLTVQDKNVVRSVNGTTADAAGNVTISIPNYGTVAQSLGTQGYVKFANGLIIQWGTAKSTSVTFPTAFASACYSITHGRTTSNNWGTMPGFHTITKTGFQINDYEGISTYPIFWLAIGK